MENQMIDHLFRHHYGKMVSILTRIFGLNHLEVIEDAVQDTFIKAIGSWRNQIPENPEGWLVAAAKNRIIDLFRKLSTNEKRTANIESGPSAIAINELFLEHEIADSQLRMIFTACHPTLNSKEQISFALKTISGFSSKEIASALLLKEETIKKRLSRARKSIQENQISFEIPTGNALPERMDRVLEILYLIFNEGFHSNKKDILIRKDLCGEALRLCKMLLQNRYTNSHASYALFALMCFQSARLDSRINKEHEIIDLKNQDRSKWHFPLIALGNQSMNKAVEGKPFTSYHYEAAIVGEHLQARTFKETNWDKILSHYENLNKLQPSAMLELNLAIVYLQKESFEKSKALLSKIDPEKLEQRAYLYYGTFAEYHFKTKSYKQALSSIDIALQLVQNKSERDYLLKKRTKFKNQIKP